MTTGRICEDPARYCCKKEERIGEICVNCGPNNLQKQLFCEKTSKILARITKTL